MGELLNVASGKPEKLSDDQVYQALAAGTHTPMGGAKPLFDPNGRLVFSPASDIQDNLTRYGFRAPSQDDLNALAKQEQYGEGAGNIAKAFGAGVARGTTFGASDYLLPKTGITTKEALAARAELNPVVSTAGEITGAVGSAALAPEFAPAARLAKATGAIGEAATGVLGRAAGAVTKEGGLASKILGAGAEVAGHGVGSAIEGAVYGLGQSVSEANLGDADLTGEKLLSHVGYGALYGGALGTMLRAGAKAIPASLEKAQEAVGNSFDKWIGSVEELPGPLQAGEKATKVFVPGKVAKTYARFASMASGEPEEAIMANLSHALTAESMTPKEFNRFLQDKMIDPAQELFNGVESLKSTAGAGRPKEWENLLQNADHPKALDQLEATKNVMKTAITEMRAKPDLFPGRFPAQLEESLATLEKAPKAIPSEVYTSINEAKQSIDKGIPWNKEIGADAAKAVPLVKGTRGVIKDILEHEPTWGDAAARQSAYNDAFHRLSTLTEKGGAFRKYFLMSQAGPGGKLVWKINPTKMNTFANMINDVRGKPAKEAMTEFLTAAREYVNQATKTHENAPFPNFEPEAITQRSADLASGVERSRGILQKEPGGFGRVTDWMTGAKPLSAAAWGGPVAFLGALAGQAFSLAKNPAGAIEKLVKIEEAAQKATNFVRTASRTVLEIGKEGTKAIPGAGMLGQKLLTGEDRRERFQKRVDEIQQRAQPQQALDHTVWATQDGFHAAPKVMGSVQQTAMRGTVFLISKIPQPLGEQTPFAKPPAISQAEITKFDRYYDAVHDPLSVLKQLGRGPVPEEATEAVRTVWPKLYAEMSRELMSNVLGNAKLVPYQKRLAICSFLGQPLEGSLTPEHIAQNQLVMNQQQAKVEAKEAQEENPKFNVSGRYKTAFQESSQGEEGDA